MLQLKNIVKNYAEGENQVRALRGVSLNFRKSEFVSILGPSGCGKTTMLNIIGGLDQYTDGDLVIDGRSTKDFRDRDWDSYRNHSIGFVFQSYNLIPHQSVLQNVEIALSLSGVSKKERRQRAKEALERVGLGDQLRKRPGEMSGGQMQRVAIARALVNNPDIILADEPTGALDTQTSVQIMEILKEISKDRLVIMVTHNPELANTYSTRIIRMLDGVITDDSAPLSEEELDRNIKQDKELAENHVKEKLPSMSFFTAFGLSLKNLFTKKGRTILTAFAGSIGIIGIALIFSFSQGTTNFINEVQEDTLSSYPLTLQATSVDLTTLMNAFMDVEEKANAEHELDAVYSQSALFDMINALNNIESTENDLKSFKSYLHEQMEQTTDLTEALSGVQYTYGLDLMVYTKNVDGTVIRSDTREMLTKAIAKNMGGSMASTLQEQPGVGNMGGMPMMNNGINLWCEMLSSNDGALINPMIKNQYELVDGNWPNEYDEIVLVVSKRNELDDMTLYALGLRSEEEIDQVFKAVSDGTQIDTTQQKWSFEELRNMTFRVVFNADCYVLDENTGLYMDLRSTDTGMRYLYDNGLDLKITGIIRPREDASNAMLTGSIAYTKALTEYVIENMRDAASIQAQLDNPSEDIFIGLPFRPEEGQLTDEAKMEQFKNTVAEMTVAQKAETFVKIASLPTQEEIDSSLAQALATATRESMEAAMLEAMKQQMSMNQTDVEAYITAMADEEITEYYSQMVIAQIAMQKAAAVQKQLSRMQPQQLAGMLEVEMQHYTAQDFARYYDQVLTFSDSSYEQNLNMLGYLDLESPASINLYASSFENKDIIEEAIAKYNESVDELKRIHYTDYVGLIMSSVTTIINAITYVLIAFVAVSLIVSSIMIGVITLISVQERTKEIGILRAIGASKANVSSMFNAETVIIGFVSGVMGIVVTYLLCIPINALVLSLTNIDNLQAHLPVSVAVGLVLVSVSLTLISGIIPSRSAAKKDPVVALRTE